MSTQRRSVSEIFDLVETGSIDTIAGSGYSVDVPAKEADAGWPHGVVRLPDGDIIVCDSVAHRLWRIDQEGILRAFAGDGVPGCNGDGGPAVEARLYMPHDIYVDNKGNVYVAQIGDYGTTYVDNTIRRIDYETGIITRIAGSGRAGFGGDGGPALNAEFHITCGVAADERGNVFACGKSHNNVRKIDAETGVIEAFVGDPGNRAGFNGDGLPALESVFSGPEHLAFDSQGSLYICDNDNNRIRKVDSDTGIVTTVLGNGQASSNGDGGLATEASTNKPDALCIDSNDNVYVGEVQGFRIRKVDAATGVVKTLVGNGVPGWGEEGKLGSETKTNAIEAGIWADDDGTVLWGDASGRLRQYDSVTELVTTLFGGTTIHDNESAQKAYLCIPTAVALNSSGDIYIADTKSQRIRVVDAKTGLIRTIAGNGARCYGGDNGPAIEAYIGNPSDISLDSQERVVFVDGIGQRLRRIDRDGVITTVAGVGEASGRGIGGPASSVSFFSLRCFEHGLDDDMYVGDGIGLISRIDQKTGLIQQISGDGVHGYSGDDRSALNARIGIPSSIAVDLDGNVYFTDSSYHVVRRIDTKGIITTLAGTGEAGCSPSGTVASDALLYRPQGIAVNAEGRICFSDTFNNRVCEITSDGILNTVAGSDTPGDFGDGSSAIYAGLNRPTGLRFHGLEILLLCDSLNNRVRCIKL